MNLRKAFLGLVFIFLSFNSTAAEETTLMIIPAPFGYQTVVAIGTVAVITAAISQSFTLDKSIQLQDALNFAVDDVKNDAKSMVEYAWISAVSWSLSALPVLYYFARKANPILAGNEWYFQICRKNHPLFEAPRYAIASFAFGLLGLTFGGDNMQNQRIKSIYGKCRLDLVKNCGLEEGEKRNKVLDLQRYLARPRSSSVTWLEWTRISMPIALFTLALSAGYYQFRAKTIIQENGPIAAEDVFLYPPL